MVSADDHGGLVARLDEVIAHPWGRATVKAIVHGSSARQAARLVQVHHSTLQARLDLLVQLPGFDPNGFGHARTTTAYLVWRLRHSTVLDLPAPTT